MAELERRYVVLKIKDLKGLSPTGVAALWRIERDVAVLREEQGKAPLRGIFIEADWPEYALVKRVLLERVRREKQA